MTNSKRFSVPVVVLVEQIAFSLGRKRGIVRREDWRKLRLEIWNGVVNEGRNLIEVLDNDLTAAAQVYGHLSAVGIVFPAMDIPLWKVTAPLTDEAATAHYPGLAATAASG